MFGYPRLIYGSYLLLTLILGLVLAINAPGWLWAWLILLALAIVGARDLRSRHNLLRNFPILGHGRYLMEYLRPELRQYFFESDIDGRPFSREQRELVYKRSRNEGDTLAFGTVHDIYDENYCFSLYSLQPGQVNPAAARITIGNQQCRRPYSSSRLNISAMSFGSLSANAVEAMNRGARLGGFAQDTGEGSLSDYHRKYGGDIIWELGTAYFGCRHEDGSFDAETFQAKATLDQVRMIEIKLSQGAKPAHGGLLPGSKVTEEIARVRQIKPGMDCHSPASHPEFDTPKGLLAFVQRLRQLADGKPVGFKLCVGHFHEFMAICKAMLETGITPDFIVVDGSEGGTGAAPAEFENFLGLYVNEAIPFVDNCLKGVGLRRDITLIASGKVTTGYDMVTKIALGADMCNAARAFMFSVGCIQARRCHTGTCPTGVTTQDPKRARALEVMSKSLRVRNYHEATIQSFLDLISAMGLTAPEQLTRKHISITWHQNNQYIGSGGHPHPEVASGDFLNGHIPEAYQPFWDAASAETFQPQ